MTRRRCPTEDVEQQMVARYLDIHPATRGRWCHPPNGGARNARTGALLKAHGVKPGVPDVLIFTPHGDHAGLAIELKRRRGGRLSDHQAAWLETLRGCGWRAEVCRGFDAARELVEACYGPPSAHQETA